MKYNTLFFDLDGTLTDSGEGIMNCAQLALEHFGLSVPSRDSLKVFVGPPLRQMLMQFGISQAQLEEAVSVFRTRYESTGKYENFPYPGIRELLIALQQHGFRLFVATSKPETMALDVLNKFELAEFFDCICGATLDGTRDSKEKVITYLLESIGGADHVVMIGDTEYDVIGARAHGIPTIGVTWGYGSEQQLRQAGAAALVHSPEALLEYLLA